MKPMNVFRRMLLNLTQRICGWRPSGHRWAELPRSFWNEVEPIVADPVEHLFNPGMKEYFAEAGILLCPRCGAVAKRYRSMYHIVAPGSFYAEHFTRPAAYVDAGHILRETGDRWSHLTPARRRRAA
jgi:hypothetical protein